MSECLFTFFGGGGHHSSSDPESTSSQANWEMQRWGGSDPFVLTKHDFQSYDLNVILMTLKYN